MKTENSGRKEIEKKEKNFFDNFFVVVSSIYVVR